MKPINVSLVLAAAAVLAACETEPRVELSPDFGNAVRHNMAIHIINPEGAPLGEPTGLNGPRTIKPYKRMLLRGDAQYGTSAPAPASPGAAVSGAAK